jgi:hypothetical protein
MRYETAPLVKALVRQTYDFKSGRIVSRSAMRPVARCAVALLSAAALVANAQPPAVEVVEAPRDPGCQQTGSRARDPCEPAKTVVTLEREMSFSIDLPPTQLVQCAAAIELEYTQRDSKARVTRTLDHRDCAASSGEYTLLVRVRRADGQGQTLEFPVSWQRADTAPVVSSDDHDIGEDVDLVSVRTRQTRCTCDPAPAEVKQQP